jgi:Fe-S cluster assembly iron-binding protein IscA
MFKMEINMEIVKVSKQVVQELKQLLQETNDESAKIRISIEMDMGGMSFRLYMDEVHEDDTVEDHDGLEFIVANELIKVYDGFTILYMQREGETYLQIQPDRQIKDVACASSSCSTCSSSSTCGENK